MSGVSSLGEGGAIRSQGRTITEADLVGFSSLTGDWHPQHADAQWAASSRFGERIAHGMLVLSYSIGLAGFDPEEVVALRGIDDLTFKRPVKIGETIRVEADVAERKPLDEEQELVTLRWKVLADGKLAVRAKVLVVRRIPGAQAEEPDASEAPRTASAPVTNGSAGAAMPQATASGAQAGSDLYAGQLLI